MKKLKTLASLMLVVLFQVACSSDDNSVIRVDQDDQIELGEKLDFQGTYDFFHAGNGIPFDFAPTTITVNMSDMAGSGQDNQVYEIIGVYQNTTNKVKKIVTKQKDENLYKAFFISEQTSESFNFNMDSTYNFDNLAQAIQTKYPEPGSSIAVDHAKEIFGWIMLSKHDGPSQITLPVNGKYEFSAQGHTYFYNFTNTSVNFNDSYSMEVLAYNTNTNKILLKGIDAQVANSYYVIQLQNITDQSVDIARKTFTEAQAKEQAESEFASKETIDAKFTTYDQKKQGETEQLTGLYVSQVVNGIAQYQFDFTSNNQAFIFAADMKGEGALSPAAVLSLELVEQDKATGQIIYLITKATGYYQGRENQYLTIYVKNIADDFSTADIAIATKDASTSISASKGDVIGTTLEQAKAIKAPQANLVWETDMNAYAHRWISAEKAK
ncbi:hypothetical protein [Myroides sp. LJL119]